MSVPTTGMGRGSGYVYSFRVPLINELSGLEPPIGLAAVWEALCGIIARDGTLGGF
jgi:hypothetical protein